ncbi:MAG: ATP-dependent DNA helicase [Eubacterium sp.]|nr:ATP-dependent DNA helicase [Eubacterium sp.]
MLTYQNHTVKTSVRRLVEFLLRSGDMVTGSALTADVEAMQEGTRLHKKIQKAQKAGYMSEVSLKMSWPRTEKETQTDYELVLEGRADGIEPVKLAELQYILEELPGKEESQEEGKSPDERARLEAYNQIARAQDSTESSDSDKLILIDEIKCIYKDVKQIEAAEPLHLAQAKCYAYMYGLKKDQDQMLVQITYCNIESEEIHRILYYYTMEELKVWFEELIGSYGLWADYKVGAFKKCMDSIERLQFPYDFRPGQKKMTAMVYHSIDQSNHMFLQAPTGIGKTISAIYPSLKGLKAGKLDRIFYLTAKTITRTVAETTYRLLIKQGMNLHSTTITAKERICILESPECDPQLCERAKGHYDRVNEALYDLLTHETLITREVVCEYAQNHQVCPYELGFEAAAFSESVICDYNYVFDPHVNGRGLFGENNRKRELLLIDEAHNFLDRAREMYSADIRKEELIYVRRQFQKRSGFIVKKLQAAIRALSGLEKEEEENVDRLYFPLMRLLGPLEDYLKDHPSFEERDEIVQIFFRLRHFFMILEQRGDGYQVYSDGRKKSYTLHLYCVDPSECIEEYLDKSRAAIFFSATLLPIHYYRQLLGGKSGIDAFAIPSPFERDHRLLAITDDVTSRYSRRGEDLYQRICAYLKMTTEVKKGNYMIFFPSYEMLSACLQTAEDLYYDEEWDILVQTPYMNEDEREQFLREFDLSRKKSMVAFCVLGSLFSEGIDLVGDRLIGAFIVGTGLPQICKEREIIRTFFDRNGKKGYDYAYRYPGMNKVLQAAGRVIRTDQDKGLILLMDDRFLSRENQTLLPEEWDSYYQVSLANYQMVLRSFWEKYK